MKEIRNKIIAITKKNGSSWLNLLILMFIALIFKQYCVYLSYRNLDYWFSFYLNNFFTDSIVLLIILWIVILNQYIKNRIIKIFNNIVCLIIFIIFCVDTFTMYFLQSRVPILQAFQYINNWWNGFTWIMVLIFISVLILRSVSLVITKNINTQSKTVRQALLSIFFFLTWLSLIFSKPKEITNIISLNASFLKGVLLQEDVYALWDETDLYIQGEDNETNINYEDYIKYIRWEWKDLNIILVFAESISAIDSASMWWNDNMPFFDKISKDWMLFTNFISNWSTSDTAHISLLYGVIPLINVWVDMPYTGYKLIMDPLPKFLNEQWYHTTFISTAPLSFLNQREFLSGAWFQKIIWEEEFKNNKKYSFDAAPDRDLYDRALQEFTNQTWKFFIWLQTISFHKPYNTPKGKTEDLALQYADQELYKFYKKLEVKWFFQSWILIIVGDHRKMEAAEDNEVNLFWKNWYVKPVATIIWTWIISWQKNDNIIQHMDFYNSIKKLVWKWILQVDSTYNDIFSKEINRDRWITNSKFFDIKYTVTYKDNTQYRFDSVSSLLQQKSDDFSKYMKAYLKYELWINDISIDDHKWTGVLLIWNQWVRNILPENSIAWFFKTKELWWVWIGLDASYTKDHQNIVAHGEYLSASNCNRQKIWNYTYDWIKQNCRLKNWEEFKTLRDMLAIVDWLFDYYFLEIKVYDESLWAQQTIDAINTVKKLNMQDRVIFISYSDAAKRVLSQDPDIIFWWDTFDVNDVDFIWENNSEYFLAPYDLLTPETVEKAKSVWKKVVTYTVNDTWNFQKMKDMWIDMIWTDEIELLLESEYNN